MADPVTLQPGRKPRTVAERLAEALAQMVGAEIAIGDAALDIDVDWRLEAGPDGAPSAIVVGLSAADAGVLASRISAEATDDEQIEAMLSQTWGVCLERLSGDGEGTWAGRVTRAAGSAAAWLAAYRLSGPEGFGVTVVIAAEPEGELGARRSQAPGMSRPATPSNLDMILDIDLPLVVRFGGADMTIDALTRLGPGALIELGRSPDEPVDVLVNGRMVARGEVVVVGGNYGVRVTEVVSAADRLRSMGM